MPFIPPLRRSVLLVLSLLSACAANVVHESGEPMVNGLPRLPVTGAPGDYLAGRHAASEGDIAKAAERFLQGLDHDPGNPNMATEAFMASLMAGRPEAVALARTMQDNLIAQLLLANTDAKAGRWDKAEAGYASLVRQGIGQVLQPVLVAWAQQGAGKTDAALATLQPLIDGKHFRGGYAVHAALIADLAGRTAQADADYRLALTQSGGINLELARMLANWDVRQGHVPEAQKVFSALESTSGELAIALPALYKAASERPVTTPVDGLAEAYLAVAGALRAQESDDNALIMLRLALDLQPNLTIARLLASDILDNGKHYNAALDMLQPVTASDPLISVVKLRQTSLLQKSGDMTGALARLSELASSNPDRAEPWAIRGDILSSQKHYAEAATAYSTAMEKSSKADRNVWPLYYARGIAKERGNDWPGAEADLLHALDLSPDQPDVLNYLAYSWTEQNHNLPRAHEMIQRAVEQRPNDGAILDSLGWVIFRQGDVKTALTLLQRASELDPSDPTVNLHLGDAYWAAGRKLEAQFQWRRSLTLDPAPEDAEKLQAKLHKSEVALGNVPPPTP